jgi:hypothetical protein
LPIRISKPSHKKFHFKNNCGANNLSVTVISNRKCHEKCVFIFVTHFITNFNLHLKKFKKGKIPYSFLPSLLAVFKNAVPDKNYYVFVLLLKILIIN